MRAGPRGPSGVKTRFVPMRARRIISRMAAEPPRDEEPREESTSKYAIVRAISSPSLLCEIRTEIGVRKRHFTIISR
jgi:hypothetical protein